MSTIEKLFVFLILFVFFVAGSSSPVVALDKNQKKVFNKNINYFNYDVCGGSGGGAQDAGTTGDITIEGPFKPKPVPGTHVTAGYASKGEASSYGEDPKKGYIDPGDVDSSGKPLKPALAGATNEDPGIAVYNSGSLGGWWKVIAPNDKSAILRQTDVGPSTSRVVDINTVAARSVFGYEGGDSFPTDQGTWKIEYVGKDKPAGAIEHEGQAASDSGNVSGNCSCGGGESFSGSVSPQVGHGASDKGKENLQKAVVRAGQKHHVDPNFIAAFYYAENARTGDSTNNADSASGTPATGDGKWRDPAPPYGSGASWDAPNGFSAYGPFQFITPTWQSYKPSGANDTSDRLDLFKSAMAAGKYLAASGAKDTTEESKLRQAAFAYNHSNTYVQSVINTYNYLANKGSTTINGSGENCDNSGGDANMKKTEKVDKDGRFITMPSKYGCGGAGFKIDSRIAADVAYIVTKYNMCVSAGLEDGHKSHGAGLAVDLVPKNGSADSDWKDSTEKAARDIGWWGDSINDSKGSKPSCAEYGAGDYGQCMYAVHPDKFPKWMRWMGYNGAYCHGDSKHIYGGCGAHLHIGWSSPNNNGADAVSATVIANPIPAIYRFPAPVPDDLKDLVD